jgi:hypothetical protein
MLPDVKFSHDTAAYPVSWIKAGVRYKRQKAGQLTKTGNWQARAMVAN